MTYCKHFFANICDTIQGFGLEKKFDCQGYET